MELHHWSTKCCHFLNPFPMKSPLAFHTQYSHILGFDLVLFSSYCILHTSPAGWVMQLEWGAEAEGKLLKGFFFTRGQWITAAAEERRRAITLSLPLAGGQRSLGGYHACQELHSLITEETLSYFFFSRLIAYAGSTDQSASFLSERLLSQLTNGRLKICPSVLPVWLQSV